MARVLVSGGAGFLGSHLVDALADAGHAVHVLDDYSTGSAFNLVRAHQRGARTTTGSVAWRPDVERVFEKFRPEVVYHLAARVDVTRSVAEPVEDAITNVQGTINVLDACARTGVRRFILTSSAAVYGHSGQPVTEDTPYQPIAPYGASKVAAQTYADMYDRLTSFRALLGDNPAAMIPATLTAVTAIFSNLYGPRQREGCGLINIAARALLRGEPVTLHGDGRNVRDYVHVGDAVRVLLDAGDLDQRQSPFTVSRRILVGTGIGTTDRAVWDLVADAVERTGTETLDVDKHLRYAPARPGDIRSSVLPAHYLATMPPRIGVRGVVEAIRKELKAVSLSIGRERERFVELEEGRPMAPITVAIPTHPARGHTSDPRTLLGRAVASVRAQTLQPQGGVSIACDLNGDGAGATRQRALDEVQTEFVSFLDSDDYLYPHHLETHWRLLTAVGEGAELDDIAGLSPVADVAYSWWGGNRPFPESTHRGIPFDPRRPHHITMTLTVRTSLAKAAGFITEPLHPDWTGEDWAFILKLCELGARFVGTGEETWHYAVHGGNTSGHPRRGDGPGR